VLYPDPTQFGKSTAASCKDYLLDWSDFQIMVDVRSTKGIDADPDKALFPKVDIKTSMGGVPLSIPVLSTIAVFTFLYAWNDFTGPLIYLQSHQTTPCTGIAGFPSPACHAMEPDDGRLVFHRFCPGDVGGLRHGNPCGLWVGEAGVLSTISELIHFQPRKSNNDAAQYRSWFKATSSS
jgi:hypothetical protein